MKMILFAALGLVVPFAVCAVTLPLAAGMPIDNVTLVLGPNNTVQGSASMATPIADVSYTASCGNHVITYLSLTAPRTVTVTPCGSSSVFYQWQIKDKSGNASPSIPITLASTSGTFDGLTSTEISEANGSKTFYDDGTNFFMVGAFLPSVNASSLIQKADGNGGLMNATAGTDYMSPANVSAAYVPQTTRVNGQPLSGNVTLSIPAAQVNSDWNASSGVAQILNKPTIPSVTRTTSPLTLALVGTGATGTQISSTKDSSVCISASTSTTSTIGGPATSIVAIKTSPTNSATEGNWVLGGQIESDQTITLAVALQSIQVVKGQACVDVPGGYFVKIENSGSGTHTETFVIGFQTIYG